MLRWPGNTARIKLKNKLSKRLLPVEIIDGKLSEDETKKLCEKYVSELNAKNIKDMGKIMGALKKNHSNELDFSIAGKILKEILNK